MQKLQEADLTDQVRRAGMRATPGRVAALDFLTANPHCTAAEVHAGIAEQLPSLSMQSVHNVVTDLTEKGLLRRVDAPGAARYETRTDDNHHHIRCVVCHRIEDVDCVTGEAPCLSPVGTTGMPVLLSADVTFQAVCTECVGAWEASRASPA
ncbi:MAG: Fur family transcriptional regulator [Brevibacterium yomogidense]